jgi:hypothetical protein
LPRGDSGSCTHLRERCGATLALCLPISRRLYCVPARATRCIVTSRTPNRHFSPAQDALRIASPDSVAAAPRRTACLLSPIACSHCPYAEYASSRYQMLTCMFTAWSGFSRLCQDHVRNRHMYGDCIHKAEVGIEQVDRENAAETSEVHFVDGGPIWKDAVTTHTAT